MTHSRMSRRDRAVFTLALELCRDEMSRAPSYRDTIPAEGVLGYSRLGRQICASIPYRWDDDGAYRRPFVARLALLLRALLRASGALDYGNIADRVSPLGTWRCPSCWQWCQPYADHCYAAGDGPMARPMVPTRRITPWHERAPSHTDQTPRQRRGVAAAEQRAGKRLRAAAVRYARELDKGKR